MKPKGWEYDFDGDIWITNNPEKAAYIERQGRILDRLYSEKDVTTLQQQNAELRAALEFCCEQIARYAGDDDCHGPSYRKAREVLAKYPKS